MTTDVELTFPLFLSLRLIPGPHGDRVDPQARRHVGDLGNIVADSSGQVEAGPCGTLMWRQLHSHVSCAFFCQVDVEFEDALISLEGPHTIIGRSVVIHADEDDLGRGTYPDSATTGHSGARVACGVIGLAEATTV
jgi:superoxide dismutase, Cu-Zn family